MNIRHYRVMLVLSDGDVVVLLAKFVSIRCRGDVMKVSDEWTKACPVFILEFVGQCRNGVLLSDWNK